MRFTSVRSVLFASLLLAAIYSSAHDKTPVTTTTTTTCPKNTTTSTTTTLPVSHNPPPTSGTTVFGPKEFRVGWFGRSTDIDSFKGLNQNPQNGQLIVTLGGDDLHCDLHPKFVCEIEQSLERFLRPREVEITLNGQVVLKHHHYPIEQKYESVAVTVNATNEIKVQLKGSPFSYIDVKVKSQGSAQHPNPLASFTVNPTTGIAPQIFTFNALASTASGATISSYAWDFGDGQVDTGSVVVHNFINAGTYSVKLTVTDSLGGVGTSTQNMIVKQNQLPIPSFTATVDPANGLLVHFDASTSNDPDGSIVSYAWNFGDGQPVAGVKADYTFAASGTYPVSLTVTDDKNGSSTQTQQITVKDTIPPVLSMQSPSAGSTIQSLSVLVAGSTDKKLSSVTAQLEGENIINLTLGTDQKSFSQTITATHDGARVLTVIATDLSGNTTTAQINFNIVVNIPPIANLAITEPPSNVAPVMVMFDASASTSPQGKALHYHFDFGDGSSVDNANGITSHQFMSAGEYTIVVTVIDSSNAQAQVQTFVNAVNPSLPPIASSEAPAISDIGIQPMVDSIKFLYSGDNPIQTNVQAGAIDPSRVAVLQGTVVDVSGNPISGVKINILEMPEIGQTLTAQDGKFHIVVNGGGVLTITYTRNGYFSIQRKIETTALDYFTANKIVMIQPDQKVTQITMASSQIQTMVGSTVSDGSGPRTSIVVIPAGTTASLKMSDGSTKSVSTLSLRSTEYTVGDQGPSQMPGDLPATTSYTYAEDITADEAIAANASHIIFSNPVPHYIDNFLNFPVGAAVPYGSYDYSLGAWVTEKDGVVLKVLDIQNGLAILDMDGSGTPAPMSKLAQINISSDELAKIASIYSIGKSFWRVQLSHLSPIDLNFLVQGPKNILTAGQAIAGLSNDCACRSTTTHASTIDNINMSLSESIGLPGTGTSLHYTTLRRDAYVADRTITIPLIAGTLPADSSLTNVHLNIQAAGQSYDADFAPSSNLATRWQWDGKDTFGRSIFGSVSATVTVRYEGPSIYLYRGYVIDGMSFGQSVANLLASGVIGRANTQYQNSQTVTMRATKFKNGSDIAGWGLSQVHQYDPLSKDLYLGDGTHISAQNISPILVRIAGQISTGYAGDGDYAQNSKFGYIQNLAVGPDSSIYINDTTNYRIRKISPSGIVSTIAGNGTNGILIEGASATSTPITGVNGIAVGSDGTLYFSLSSGKIEKITSDGYVQRVAGNGGYGFGGDGGPAIQATFANIGGFAISSDGNIYIADSGNSRIRKITPDGLINTYAGNGKVDSSGDEGSALSAGVYYPTNLVVGPNKEVYFLESSLYQIRVISSDGIVHHFAGIKGSPGYSGDEGPAANAQFNLIRSMDISSSGILFIGDQSRIRSITPDGNVHLVAGGDGSSIDYSFNYTNAQMPFGQSVNAVTLKIYSNDKFIYSEGANIRSYQPALPALNPNGYSIASQDGSEIYQFSSTGIHLQTLFAKSGKVKWTFGYDSNARIVSMADAGGLVTTINRDGNGRAMSIVGPFGQTSFFSINDDGYLSKVVGPSGEATAMSYYGGGLISEFKNPRGNSSKFQYDIDGTILSDIDANNATINLTRKILAALKYNITSKSPMGRITQTSIDTSTSSHQYQMLFPDGRRVDQFTSKWANSTNDYGGYSYNFGNKDIDPRLGGITQFYASQSWSNNAGPDYLQTNSYYTPLSSTDFFKYTQQQVTQLNGSMTLNEFYDSTKKSLVTQSGLGRTSSFSHNDFERPVVVVHGDQLPIQYVYDMNGFLTSVTQGERATNFTYNSHGKIQSVTDPLGQVEQYSYDDSNRLLSIVRPDGSQVQYSYDLDGNLLSLQTPNKDPHLFTYNNIDLLVGYTIPSSSGNQVSLVYNADRQLIQKINPDGGQINYTYDATSGNLTKEQGSLKSIIFQSSGSGATYPTISQTSDGISLYVQSQGDIQLDRYYQTSGPVQARMGYTYGDQFRLNQIRFYQTASGFSTIPVNYQYDGDNLLVSAGDLNFTRNTADGVVTSTQIGNVSQSYSYNGYGDIIQDITQFSGSNIFSEQYTVDKLGRISSKIENILGASTTYSYSYDLAGRLVDVFVNGSQTSHYAYDSSGNRILKNSISSTYDGQDRLIHAGLNNYIFDANGNLSQKQNGSDLTKYQYDDFGQLSQVNLPSGQVIKYFIDGDTNRVEKIVDGMPVKKYAYNANRTIGMELNMDNTVKSIFIYSSESHSPEYMIQGNAEYKFIKDYVGSIRLVVNINDGSILERIDYDEFGNVTSDSNPGFQPFGFAGGIYDADTKLVRFGDRDYDPEVGRWTQKDSTLFDGSGPNLYEYVWNDPINFVDPSGDGGQTPVEAKLINVGKSWVGTPYSHRNNPQKGANGGADCSHATNEIFKEAGFPYNYAPAWGDKGISHDPHFELVSGNPEPGDVAVWDHGTGNSHMLIYTPDLGDGHDSLTAFHGGPNAKPFGEGNLSGFTKQLGKPQFYRYKYNQGN